MPSMFAYSEPARKPKVRPLHDADSHAANYNVGMQTEDEFLIGAQLKGWRKSKGLTLDQMAADLDTSKGHLSDMERGKRPISSRWLERISEFYGATVSDIIHPGPARGGLPADLMPLLHQLQDAGKMAEALTFLRFLAAEAESARSPVGAHDGQGDPKAPGPR